MIPLVDGVVADSDPAALRRHEQLLEDRTGRAYARWERALMEGGGAPGSHAPLLLVLSELIRLGRVRRVLELGSGMTTLYLAAALAARRDGVLCALEEVPAWHGRVADALLQAGLPDAGLHLVDGMLGNDALVAAGAPYDLVVSDCGVMEHRWEAIDAYAPHLAGDCVLLFDDCELLVGEHVAAWAARAGRDLRLFMSWSRGIGVHDPGGKLDGVVSFSAERLGYRVGAESRR